MLGRLPACTVSTPQTSPSMPVWVAAGACFSDFNAPPSSRGFVSQATPGNRYFRFGVREHGMAAICNGMAAYGGLIPYCATFLNFISYGIGAVRLSALSGFRVLYIMTHDSIGLGEVGCP